MSRVAEGRMTQVAGLVFSHDADSSGVAANVRFPERPRGLLLARGGIRPYAN